MPKKTEEQNKKVNSKLNVSKKAKSSTSVDKKDTSVKKVATAKKTTSKTSTKSKSTTTKKATSKSTVKKSTTKKTKTTSNIIEYYDLPYKYNQTIVKILAQTPHTLFVYWEISDEDRKKYIKTFGNDFFNKSVPILIVTNTTKNYSFEIEINDFANSWYFNVSDDKCTYNVELGRRSISYDLPIPDNYLYVASSNKIEAPNGHILFDPNQKLIYFRNTKTNEIYEKDIASFQFMKFMSKIYNLNSLSDYYKIIYKNENIFDINNPTSGNPTSGFNNF